VIIETLHRGCNRYRVTRLFYYLQSYDIYMLMVNIIWLISSFYSSDWVAIRYLQ